jgi:hypothetical protein
MACDLQPLSVKFQDWFNILAYVSEEQLRVKVF